MMRFTSSQHQNTCQTMCVPLVVSVSVVYMTTDNMQEAIGYTDAMSDNRNIVLLLTISPETLGRLMRLANECGADPIAIASSLLHDVLEDEEANACLARMPAASEARN